jgi:hypothetical protein
MKHIFSVGLLALLLTGSLAQAQITEDPDDRRANGQQELKTTTPEGNPLPFSQRLRFGGGIGPLRFGGGVTQLGVSPVVAYNATEHLILGAGLSYVYTRYSTGGYYGVVAASTTNQVGGRGFAMYEVVPALVPNLYAHAELEVTSVNIKVDGSGASYSDSYTAPLLGVTYMQPISRRFGINLTALYNLNYSSSSANLSSYLYGSPFVLRVSFF